MSCPRCKSNRSFQFESTQGGVVPEQLPLVCRDCGLISIGGTAVLFPKELEQQAKTLANLAVEAGQAAKDDLLADPEQRIEAYLANVYRRGYLEGFWRALLFWRHEGKEGRLRRVRELWREHRPFAHLAGAPRIAIEMPQAAYDELRQLLELGDHHAPRPANERPSPPPRDPRVP